ncbi:hypothetical protein CYMTET_27697, partial [Cymbomonas tetramitiformis]
SQLAHEAGLRGGLEERLADALRAAEAAAEEAGRCLAERDEEMGRHEAAVAQLEASHQAREAKLAEALREAEAAAEAAASVQSRADAGLAEEAAALRAALAPLQADLLQSQQALLEARSTCEAEVQARSAQHAAKEREAAEAKARAGAELEELELLHAEELKLQQRDLEELERRMGELQAETVEGSAQLEKLTVELTKALQDQRQAVLAKQEGDHAYSLQAEELERCRAELSEARRATDNLRAYYSASGPPVPALPAPQQQPECHAEDGWQLQVVGATGQPEAQPPSPGRDHEAGSASESKGEELLQVRLDAMETIVRIQEGEVAKAADKARVAGAGGGAAGASMVEGAAAQLLGRWREEVFKLLLERQRTALVQEQGIAEERRRCAGLQEQLDELLAGSKVQQQREIGLRAELQMETEKSRGAKVAQAQGEAREKALQHDLDVARATAHGIAAMVAEEHTKGASVLRGGMAAVAQLDAFQRRLAFAEGRLAIAAQLFACREGRSAASEPSVPSGAPDLKLTTRPVVTILSDSDDAGSGAVRELQQEVDPTACGAHHAPRHTRGSAAPRAPRLARELPHILGEATHTWGKLSPGGASSTSGCEPCALGRPALGDGCEAWLFGEGPTSWGLGGEGGGSQERDEARLQVAELQAELRAVEQRAAAAEEQARESAAALQTATRNAGNAERRVAKLETEVEALQAAVERETAATAAAQARIVTLEEAASVSDSAVREMERHMERTASQVRSSEAAAAERAQAARTAQQEAEEAHAVVEELQRDRDSAQRAADRANVALRQLERQLSRMKDRSAREDRAKTEYLEEQLARRDEQLKDVRKERNALLAAARRTNQRTASHSSDSEPSGAVRVVTKTASGPPAALEHQARREELETQTVPIAAEQEKYIQDSRADSTARIDVHSGSSLRAEGRHQEGGNRSGKPAGVLKEWPPNAVSTRESRTKIGHNLSTAERLSSLYSRTEALLGEDDFD